MKNKQFAKYPLCNKFLCYIDKEKDRESKLGDHGVRKYDYEIGRFTSIDPLWEKYTGWTGYQYTRNNPINRIDYNGMDENQRKGALEFAKSYLHSGSVYLLGAKNLPGKPVDCSGLVNNSVVEGGGEKSLVGRKGVTGTGVQQIEKVSIKIDDVNQIEPGNIITFRTGGNWGFHTGIVNEVFRNEEGKVYKVSYIHSSSTRNGPGIDSKNIDNKKIHGFYKWDTIPDDKKEVKAPKTITDTQKQIDPNIMKME